MCSILDTTSLRLPRPANVCDGSLSCAGVVVCEVVLKLSAIFCLVCVEPEPVTHVGDAAALPHACRGRVHVEGRLGDKQINGVN